MAKPKIGIHGMVQTEGQFKLTGLVTGVKRDNFYSDKDTAKGDAKRVVKFGVETSTENTVYVIAGDREKKEVIFYSKEEKEVIKVPWSKRLEFKKEGYELIGKKTGIETFVDDKGKTKNDTKNLTEFDTADYINDLATNEKFKDAMAVKVIGDLEFSSFEDDKGEMVRYKKFAVGQLYNSFVEFDAEDFVEESTFKQKFIYISSEMKEDKKTEKKYLLVSGLVCNYFGFEEVEFYVRNKNLAMNMNKKLKAYSAITVHGNIENRREEDEETKAPADDWGGEPDTFANVDAPRKFEFLIKGIDTANIDTKTYTKKKVEEAMQADNDYGTSVKKNENVEDKSGEDWDKKSDDKNNDGW